MQTLAAHAGERHRTPEHAPRNRTEAEDRRDRGGRKREVAPSTTASQTL
jgi:hypothetical protein